MTQAQIGEAKKRLCTAMGTTEREILRTSKLFLCTTDIKALLSSRIEIGNHSKTHTFFRSLSEAELETEIVESCVVLEESIRAIRSMPEHPLRKQYWTQRTVLLRQRGAVVTRRFSLCTPKATAFPRRLTFSIGSASEIRPPRSFRSGSASCQYCEPSGTGSVNRGSPAKTYCNPYTGRPRASLCREHAVCRTGYRPRCHRSSTTYPEHAARDAQRNSDTF